MGTIGSKSWAGGAVPLDGESEIVQQTAATDILTITGAASQSGDFLVCRSSAGTEEFSISSAGALVLGGGLTLGGDIVLSNALTITCLTTAVTANTTTTSLTAGSLCKTSHATGRASLFVSDGLVAKLGPSKIIADLRRTLKCLRLASRAMWPVQQQRLSAMSGLAYA